MNNEKYWSKRYEELLMMELGKAEKVDESLQRAYLRSAKKIENLIRSWYARYMNVNDISLADAQKELSMRDKKEFLWTVQDYINNGNADNLSAEIKQMLENASIKYHVTRLEAIQAQLVMQLNDLFTLEHDRVSTLASEIYQSAYYHSIYERERIKKKLSNFNVLPTDAIRAMLEKPYASDGLNFSQRIYKNRDKVIKEVNSILLGGLIQGRNSDRETRELAKAIVDELTVNDTIEDINKKMRNARVASKRLILTEASFFANQGVANSCKELGSEQYQLIATLDTHTSNICQRMDLQIFPVDQMVVGINYPPFHPYCRTVVAPYDEFQDENDTRIGRDENGKKILIPHDMPYSEWYNKYIVGGQHERLTESIARNGAGTSKEAPDFSQLKIEPLDPQYYPDEIVGAKRGKPMTFEEANYMRANPNYIKGGGYLKNCQTCVVAYEARRRGYNVEALPNKAGSYLRKLSRDVTLAWIDPSTGKNPIPISTGDEITTAKRCYKWLLQTLEQGKRYTMDFEWKGRKRIGHIIHVFKEDDRVIFYDPQTSRYIDDQRIIAIYLEMFKYKRVSQGKKRHCRVNLMPVSELEFNLSFIEHILKKAE